MRCMYSIRSMADLRSEVYVQMTTASDISVGARTHPTTLRATNKLWAWTGVDHYRGATLALRRGKKLLLLPISPGVCFVRYMCAHLMAYA